MYDLERDRSLAGFHVVLSRCYHLGNTTTVADCGISFLCSNSCSKAGISAKIWCKSGVIVA